MTGDQNDFYTRINSLLPSGWFADSSPIKSGVLNGLAEAHAFIYSLYAYAKLQTRIKTATDAWLDLIAFDYFGLALQRTTNQSDTSFRNRIIINLFRERATRNGLIKVLVYLTGRTPTIFEPLRPMDTGAYGVAAETGYGVTGGYGSMLLPFQAFVTAYRPTSAGVPVVMGYSGTVGGYGVASKIEYASMSFIIMSVTDSDIYSAIDSVKPAATTVWTAISS